MCGIVGIASSAQRVETRRIAEVLPLLAHRGPDAAGLWSAPDQRVILGHRRLSIIDLSERAAQPMADAACAVHVVLNGEIYNYGELRADLIARGHVFRSDSDTEVLLESYREWGTDCLTRLNGMFAFALYDAVRERLFVARDRAGEKPLFYRHTNGEFAFASELKVLMADSKAPRRLDLEALDFYVAYGYVAGGRCLLSGALKLAPAHALTYDLRTDAVRQWRYWDLPEPIIDQRVDAQNLVDQLETLLGDAVRRQLVADVPVGVLLSGGLDSSLVTAFAARYVPSGLKTFTIAFPDHGAYDEGPYARMVAEHFGTDHTELVAEPATVDLLPFLARQYDEPIADSSMVPTYLVSKLIRQEATVALGGDGGDELFGGYPLYSWIIGQQRLRRLVPGPFRSLIGAVARRLPLGFRGRTHMMSLGMPAAYAVARTGLYFDREARLDLFPALADVPPEAPERYRISCASRARTELQQLTTSDFFTYLPDDILVKVDRASMLNSLEVRAPFLDHRVIEFAFGCVPDALRATRSSRKVLLRLLGKRHLPPQLDLKRKQGFSIPLHSWFKGRWGEYLEGVLRDADPLFLNPRAVDRLLAAQRRGYSNTQRIFLLAMLELWRREYAVEGLA